VVLTIAAAAALLHPTNIGFFSLQPASRRTRLASEKYAKNIDKRGTLKKSDEEEKSSSGLSKPVIYFLIFVVCGSSIFQLINMLTRDRMF